MWVAAAALCVRVSSIYSRNSSMDDVIEVQIGYRACTTYGENMRCSSSVNWR